MAGDQAGATSTAGRATSAGKVSLAARRRSSMSRRRMHRTLCRRDPRPFVTAFPAVLGSGAMGVPARQLPTLFDTARPSDAAQTSHGNTHPLNAQPSQKVSEEQSLASLSSLGHTRSGHLAHPG
jgi:hypothetical protein